MLRRSRKSLGEYVDPTKDRCWQVAQSIAELIRPDQHSSRSAWHERMDYVFATSSSVTTPIFGGLVVVEYSNIDYWTRNPEASQGERTSGVISGLVQVGGVAADTAFIMYSWGRGDWPQSAISMGQSELVKAGLEETYRWLGNID